MMHSVDAGVLSVAYRQVGADLGWPVVLLHGFPYDIHAYDQAAPSLARQGARVLIPYLRGFGATRFLSEATLRSGQQAALGADLLALLDALGVERALLAGYDWGGRAACVAAALWPERVEGLVSVGGYNIQNIAASAQPDKPENEHRYWYQYYFHSERGRAGLKQNRREFCRLLWRLWSPAWSPRDGEFELTAASFDNPDFVEVAIHSYRHRYGLVPGDPACEDMERRLAVRPPIAAPTISLAGSDDGVALSRGPAGRDLFTGPFEHRVVPGAGHNLPQEAPQAFVEAVIAVKSRA